MATEKQRAEIEAFEKQVEEWEIPKDDELLNNLKAILSRDLISYVKHFLQCKSMKRLESPRELSNKIGSLTEACLFYIGYTKAIDEIYLWTKSAKGEAWEERCRANQAPDKTHTYFTDLNGTLTKDDLIRKWMEKKEKQCLNRTTSGEEKQEGIVYVLVYEYVDTGKDRNKDGMRQNLEEGGLKDKAFREKTEEVQEVTVLGRQPEEESDSESDDGSITASPAS